MRRTAVGILALLLIAVAGYGFLQHGVALGEANFFWSSCWRIGLVLGAVWLAMPKLLDQQLNVPPMVLVTGGLTALLVVVRPRMIIFLWPIFVILGITLFVRWLMQPPVRRK